MRTADQPSPTFCPVFAAHRRVCAAVAEAELAHAHTLDRGRLREATALELCLSYLHAACGTLERLLPKG